MVLTKDYLHKNLPKEKKFKGLFSTKMYIYCWKAGVVKHRIN